MNIDKFYDEIIRGHLDGLTDVRMSLPEGHNYSKPYVFGWLNGRDHRLGIRKDSPATVTRKMYKIMKAAGGLIQQ